MIRALLRSASIFFGALLLLSTAAAAPDAAADRMQRKLDRLERNSEAAHPDQSPTEFSEQEINAYIASGEVELPAGVQSVRCQLQPGTVTANTRVDFDQLKAGRSSMNPLLSIFSGVHDAVVAAHAHGSGGQGMVHIDSVQLDGVEIPQFVLQLFVEKFLKPKYPEIGLDSRFALPEKIDTATIGLHKVTVTQK